MTQPRQSQISLSDTPYYYCISRCVCRAFLCGEDKYTGKSFEDRKQWMIERIHYLASIFNLDIFVSGSYLTFSFYKKVFG